MDREIINNIKSLAIDMIENAGSGHPGIALGAAPIIYTLYSRHINLSINDTNWISRDRFVLSKGHAAPALYSALANRGYFDTEELKNLRHIDSNLQGHPDMNKVPGVDMNTGSLRTRTFNCKWYCNEFEIK